MKKSIANDKSRDKRYIEKKKSEGYVRLSMWVKKTMAKEIKEFISDLNKPLKFTIKPASREEIEKIYPNIDNEENSITHTVRIKEDYSVCQCYSEYLHGEAIGTCKCICHEENN